MVDVAWVVTDKRIERVPRRFWGSFHGVSRKRFERCAAPCFRQQGPWHCVVGHFAGGCPGCCVQRFDGVSLPARGRVENGQSFDRVIGVAPMKMSVLFRGNRCVLQVVEIINIKSIIQSS